MTITPLVRWLLAVLLTLSLEGIAALDPQRGILRSPSSKQIQWEDIYKWDWRDCEESYVNRTDALYHQLKDLVEVLDRHNMSYIVTYGTLIGVMRDHSMNPFEVDNDILLLDDPVPYSQALYQDLYDHGLIMIHHEVFRICRRRKRGPRDNNWDPWYPLYYYPYTDLNTLDTVRRDLWPEKLVESFLASSDREIVQRKLGKLSVSTPNDKVAEEYLANLYGDWRTEPQSWWEPWDISSTLSGISAVGIFESAAILVVFVMMVIFCWKLRKGQQYRFHRGKQYKFVKENKVNCV